MARYTVTVDFETTRPLTEDEWNTLHYSAYMIAAEPVGDDGGYADWVSLPGRVAVTMNERVGR